jgi:crotonobetainyl-CoA:carnitine CoA-transferase CaiB-like acyl-CoA transferase
MAGLATGGALEGVRVLDLADEKGLPCTKFLADLGADVIKVEQPGGDESRARPPFAGDVPHPERSLYFLHYNSNKRGITLDLATRDGQELFRRLASTADVLVETFNPRQMDAWGLDYASLSKLNPGLIECSITVFGQTGPYRDYNGDELVAFAMGGLMAMSGDPGGPPIVAPGDLASGMASMHAALAIEVALFHRGRTGRGQQIDASLAEAATHIGNYVVPFYSYHKEKPVRTSHKEQTFELHDVYRCKDGWVRLFILPRDHWLTLLEWIGNPPELSDPVFEDQHMRRENSDLINPYVEQLCQRYTKQELYLEGQQRHLAITPMNNPAEFVDSPQTQARGFFAEVEHPVVGKYRQIGAMHRYSEASHPIHRAAPLVGQHNDDIFIGELGLTPEELAALRAGGVI